MGYIFIRITCILLFISPINGKSYRKEDFLSYGSPLSRIKRFPENLFSNQEYFMNFFDNIYEIFDKVGDKMVDKKDCSYEGKLNPNYSLNSSISRNLNPCSDFYSYVCSGWYLCKDEIPKHSRYMNRYTEAYIIAENRFKDIVDSFNNSSNVFERSVYNYFDNCVDYHQNDQNGTKYVLNIIKKNEYKKLSSLEDLMISRHYQPIFYQISSGYIFGNTSMYQMAITLNNPDERYDCYCGGMDKNSIKKYKKYLKGILELIRIEDPDFFESSDKKSEINDRIKVLQSYSKFLRKINSDYVYNQTAPSYYDYITVNELNSITPSVNWTNYFLKTFPNKILNFKDVSNMKVLVNRKDMLSKIENYLTGLSDESYRYLIDWIILFNNYDKLDTKFQDLTNKYFPFLGRKYTNEDIIDMCYMKIYSTFQEFMDYSYLKMYFKDNEKKDVENIVKNLLRTMDDMIYDADWISSKTKNAISKKLTNMEVIVGYDNKTNYLLKIYDDLSEMEPLLDSDNYLEMTEKISKWLYDQSFVNYITQNITDIVGLTVYSDIFYSEKENILIIPGVYLQKDYYSINNSVPLNYGGIGFLTMFTLFDRLNDCSKNYIDFDDSCKFCDKNTKKSYSKIKKCIDEAHRKVSNHEDYESFKYLLLNDEVINKDAVLKVVYKAMKKAFSSYDSEDKRNNNGLEDFNEDQLFFINYAFNYCERDRDCVFSGGSNCDGASEWKKSIVNSPLKNNEDFKEAFNCKAGDTMANENVCKIF
uniref:Endothelin-converting enzyme-like 1 (inferred by orthology to a human protein) n=1 Tax=Strongyloides venezuelensis TaxID=75913 RepID=A0A0K0FZS9_STRVS